LVEQDPEVEEIVFETGMPSARAGGGPEDEAIDNDERVRAVVKKVG
jgi:hypothetical protein